MRVKIIAVLFFTFLVLVAGRLFYWQVVAGPVLAKAASLQRSAVEKIPAQRGLILSKDGNILVGNDPSYLLFASTIDLKQSPAQLAHLIGPIIFQYQKDLTGSLVLNKGQTAPDVNEQNIELDLVSKLSAEKSYYVPLYHYLPQKYVDEIKSLIVFGLGFDLEPIRLYPEGAMAATTLGFVASGNLGQPQGYFGLEGYYDGELAGTSGLQKLERDASGKPILIGTYDLQLPQDGRSIKTTIDRYVQFVVEKHLREGLIKYGAKQASAVVMDPKTGDILASATLPSFDPRDFSIFGSDLYRDGSVGDTFEPGSIFKAVTMAAGLDTGTLTPTTVCPICDKAFTVQGHEIQTWNNSYFSPGTETMTTVLEHSDNVGAAWVANKLGKDTYFKYAKAFGVGDRTGVDIEGEQAGVFYDGVKNIQPIDLATMSFGQGFSLTALKMVQIYASFANNGLMMQPRFVSTIIAGDKTIDIPVKQVGQIVKPQTSKVLGDMLVAAVENGEARRIIPHGMRIAGKTGTAQVPIAGHYDPNKTVASFIGYGPVDNPRFVMIIKYTEPTSSPYAALTAEPTFFDIAKDLYGYFGLATTNP